MGPTAFDAAHVMESMTGQGCFSGKYVSPLTTTFSCVDSRAMMNNDIATLQTPGGDIAELQGGIVM